MSIERSEGGKYFLCFVWNVMVFLTCAYAVFGLGRDPLWFILVLIFFATTKKRDDDVDR